MLEPFPLGVVFHGFPFVLAFQDFVSAAAFSGDFFFPEVKAYSMNAKLMYKLNRLVYF